jgi:lysophospholipase L1-like esterase
MTRVLVFGASVSAGFSDEKGGWVSYLTEDLHRRSMETGESNQVYNLGVSGHTSSDILARLEHEITAREEEYHDLILIISTGGNDALYNSEKQGAEVPLDQFKSNLNKILDVSRERADEVYLLGNHPVDPSQLDEGDLLPHHSLRPELREKYFEEARKISGQKGVHFISLKDSIDEEKFREKLFDGLHPNTEGHREIYEIVRQTLEQESRLRF